MTEWMIRIMNIASLNRVKIKQHFFIIDEFTIWFKKIIKNFYCVKNLLSFIYLNLSHATWLYMQRLISIRLISFCTSSSSATCNSQLIVIHTHTNTPTLHNKKPHTYKYCEWVMKKWIHVSPSLAHPSYTRRSLRLFLIIIVFFFLLARYKLHAAAFFSSRNSQHTSTIIQCFKMMIFT